MDNEHDQMGDDKRMWRMKWREQMGMRLLAAIIVTIFVFWCGFEFGEIHEAVLGSGRMDSMMMRGGWGGAGATVLYNGTTEHTIIPVGGAATGAAPTVTSGQN